MKNPKTQKFYVQLDTTDPLLPTYTNTPLCSDCGRKHIPTAKCRSREEEKLFILSSLTQQVEKTRAKLTTFQAFSSHLTIATDCSGIEAPIQALRNMGINFQHLFSSDNDPMVRRMIEANAHLKPTTYYGDITLRDPKQTPTADI